MTMVNDIAEPLMRQSQQPRCPRNAPARLGQCRTNQIALALVYFLFKRAGNSRYSAERKHVDEKQLPRPAPAADDRRPPYIFP